MNPAVAGQSELPFDLFVPMLAAVILLKRRHECSYIRDGFGWLFPF